VCSGFAADRLSLTAAEVIWNNRGVLRLLSCARDGGGLRALAQSTYDPSYALLGDRLFFVGASGIHVCDLPGCDGDGGALFQTSAPPTALTAGDDRLFWYEPPAIASRATDDASVSRLATVDPGDAGVIIAADRARLFWSVRREDGGTLYTCSMAPGSQDICSQFEQGEPVTPEPVFAHRLIVAPRLFLWTDKSRGAVMGLAR
jgi:hypothetical protein